MRMEHGGARHLLSVQHDVCDRLHSAISDGFVEIGFCFEALQASGSAIGESWLSRCVPHELTNVVVEI